MKFRHAAALALLLVAPNMMVACTAQPKAWYLMKPPNLTSGTGPNLHAPYSGWNRVKTFDSHTDCLRESTRREEMVGDPVAHTVQLQGGVWMCAATDDPRLKGK